MTEQASLAAKLYWTTILSSIALCACAPPIRDFKIPPSVIEQLDSTQYPSRFYDAKLPTPSQELLAKEDHLLRATWQSPDPKLTSQALELLAEEDKELGADHPHLAALYYKLTEAAPENIGRKATTRLISIREMYLGRLAPDTLEIRRINWLRMPNKQAAYEQAQQLMKELRRQPGRHSQAQAILLNALIQLSPGNEAALQHMEAARQILATMPHKSAQNRGIRLMESMLYYHQFPLAQRKKYVWEMLQAASLDNFERALVRQETSRLTQLTPENERITLAKDLLELLEAHNSRDTALKAWCCLTIAELQYGKSDGPKRRKWLAAAANFLRQRDNSFVCDAGQSICFCTELERLIKDLLLDDQASEACQIVANTEIGPMHKVGQSQIRTLLAKRRQNGAARTGLNEK